MHLNVCNVQSGSTSQQQEATACLLNAPSHCCNAPHCLPPCRTNARGKNTAGDVKVLLRLDACRWWEQASAVQGSCPGREQQPGPALIRGLNRAHFSLRIVHWKKKNNLLSFKQRLQKCKAAAKALAPAEPQLIGRQSSARSSSGAGEDLCRNKHLIFLPTSSLMRLWL